MTLRSFVLGLLLRPSTIGAVMLTAGADQSAAEGGPLCSLGSATGFGTLTDPAEGDYTVCVALCDEDGGSVVESFAVPEPVSGVVLAQGIVARGY